MHVGNIGATVSADFVISVGDNMYDNGTKNEFDERFNVTFENVYKASSLQKRWYMVAGNRDYYGNITSEVSIPPPTLSPSSCPSTFSNVYKLDRIF